MTAETAKSREATSREGRFTGYDRELVLLLVVFTVLVALAMRWYYVRQKQTVLAATVQELSAVADAARVQVTNWRRERLGDARVLMAPPMQRIALKILADPGGSSLQQAELSDMLKALHDSFGYVDGMLVNLEGDVRMRIKDPVHTESGLTKAQRRALAEQTIAAGEPLLSDVTSANRYHTRGITLSVPVGKAGSLILQIDAGESLFPMLRIWAGGGETGECYLVRSVKKMVWYLSPLRHKLPAGQAPDSRSIQHLSIPSDEAMAKGAVAEGLDYRGVQVLTQLRPIPNTDWYVVVKMDRAEIEAPMARLGTEIAVVMALVAMLNAAGICVVWYIRQLRMQNESEQHFRAIADDTPAFLWMVSRGGEQFFVNKALGAFLGVESSQATSGWTKFLHPDDAARVSGKLTWCFEAQQPFEDEARLRRADGEYRWVAGRGQPRISSDNDFLGYTGTLLDITERKAAEEKLMQTNAALATELANKTRREAEIRALSARLIDAQQEERTRLARELHDDLSQEIAAVSIATGNLKRGLPADLEAPRAQTDRIQQRLVDLSESVRRISHQLHPSALNHSGLGAALSTYCREFEKNSGIQVLFQACGECNALALPVASHVYRICQEALRNVARHAHADQAEVTLACTDDALTVIVADSGKGMSPSAPELSGGLGLVSMRERARLVNGTIQIDSSPGKGTRLTIRIPLTAATLKPVQPA